MPFCSDFRFEPSWITPHATASWSLDKRLIGEEPFTKCFQSTGQYVITGKLNDSITGCVNTQTYLVTGRAKPYASFTWEPEKPVETFDEVRLLNNSIGDDQSSWIWQIEGVSGVIKSENYSYNFPDAGSYRIVYVVENKWGCVDTTIQLLTVEADFAIFVPNAFTPNIDSRNEAFKPSIRGVSHYYFQVFNRWGERLFVTENPEEGWDGSFQTQLCKTDNYVWKIVLTTTQGEQKEFKGSVILIR